MLLQREVAIEDGEHAPALTARLARTGADLLVGTLARLSNIEPVPQDPSRATLAPLLTRDDGRIDPAWTAAEIAGRVRGFDPWPGAWVAVRGRRMRLAATRPLEAGGGREPGTLSELRPDGVVLECGASTRLLLTRVQPEGRREIGARDAVHGRQFAIGERVERPNA
jgi:methionyl-tRNA formyltransferase